MQESKLLLVEDNPGDARLVKEMLADAGDILFRIHTADCLVAALDALAQGKFDVALVDLALPDSTGLETLSTIQRHAPGLPIVALTGHDSSATALAAVEQGAQDYLVKGALTPEVLVRALQYAVVRRHTAGGQAQAKPAAVVGVLGAKGGVGTTTIACHYAIELRRQSQQKVLLVDLDVSAASASFLMKPKSEFTMADASLNLHRLDASFWNNLVSQTSHGVDLLRSPGAVRYCDELSGERVRHVLRFARPFYGHIVVDLGRLNTLSMHLAEEVGELLIVTTPELPSLHETSRIVQKLLELGMPRERIHLLLNRSSRATPFSAGDLERALGYPVLATFGDYAGELHEMYGNGNFLDEGQQMSKQTRKLVAKVLGTEEPEAPARTGLRLPSFVRA